MPRSAGNYSELVPRVRRYLGSIEAIKSGGKENPGHFEKVIFQIEF
jgi:hypothetical protein